jgi:hypothetical protein
MDGICTGDCSTVNLMGNTTAANPQN